MLNKFFSIKSQKGVTMIEYALIAALVAMIAITGIAALGSQLGSSYEHISTSVSNAAPH
jgi:pilus assembly protein Flp/PilA